MDMIDNASASINNNKKLNFINWFTASVVQGIEPSISNRIITVRICSEVLVYLCSLKLLK